MTQEAQYVQLDFFHLLPGSAGGRTLRDLRGVAYFAELARTAAANRSAEERKRIAQKSTKARLRRLYTTPRTEVSEWRVRNAVYRITERVIPWWPHRTKRKRPIFVRIELDCERLEETTE